MMRITLAITCWMLLIAGSVQAASSKLQGSHGDKRLLPRSCQACHRGMNMAIRDEEVLCLDCHGGQQRRDIMSEKNYLAQSSGVQLQDIDAELQKTYRHPVITTSRVHRADEVLPEEMLSAKRHSECIDCHDPHLVEQGRPYAGITGRRVGNLITEIAKEYELCYKCHSISANLPFNSSNKAEEFKTTNASFHPIEGEGRQAFVVSLRNPYVARQQRPNDISIISCSDCHGSDNPNGPKGPHGSNYRGLLSNNYEMEDSRPEGDFAYDLCYKCHDRSSILGNESFPFHAQHIQGNQASGQSGTTCFTCHDAHGSPVNPYLIRFNEALVRPNADNKLEYKQIGVSARHGSCTLNCHGVEHKERAY